MAEKKPGKGDAKTAKAVEGLLKPGTKPGRYSAGDNLYLKVGNADGQRSWTYVYRWRGALTSCGLGSAFEVKLADARKAATACRKQLDDGIKPGSDADAAPCKAPTFGEVADQVIEAKAAGWIGDDGRERWEYQLSRRRDEDGQLDGSGFCKALIHRPVNDIVTQDIVNVLRPLWLEHPRQAELMRFMLKAVLAAATALGHRTGSNPADLETLKELLPEQNAVTKHHEAHPYQDAPAFVARLRGSDEGTGALALEWLILSWTRDRETREARWREIDRANAVWVIPPERMKGKKNKRREHRVPLTARMLQMLDEAAKLRLAGCDGSSLIFPGTKRGRPVSNKWFRNIMDRMDSTAAIHGWRSTGRDWAGETTAHPHDICEAALSHLRKDKTHAAYQRGDLLEKRRKLMADWATYLEGKPVVTSKGMQFRRVRRLMTRKPVLAIAA